jgi:hypothetical protein
MATGLEKKEIDRTADIFWSREPLMGHKGTKENPAIIPSFNTSRCVGLETEQVRVPGRDRVARLRPTTPRPPVRAMRQDSWRTRAEPSRCCACARAPWGVFLQGVIWFRIEKGPLHLVADQYFKLEQIQGGDH